LDAFLLSAAHAAFARLASFPTRRSSDLSRDGLGERRIVVNKSIRMRTRNEDRSHKIGWSVFAHLCPACPKLRIRKGVGFQTKSGDRKSTRLNSSHVKISYAVFCLKKKRL